MNLGQFLLLVVILGAILAFVGVPWWMARRKEPVAWNPANSYLDAIDALMRGDRRVAILALRDLARNDAENLGAYLRLGDLVRRMGHHERAYRIHADLLARRIGDADEQRRLYESLLEDLDLLGRHDEARPKAEALLAIDRRNPTALRSLVRYHERRGDWEKALELLDEWDSACPGKTRPTPAQMRIHMARLHLDAGRLREAGKLLDEAQKLSPDGVIAHVFRGDLLASQGEVQKAIEEWMLYVREHGYRSDQVFARLEKAYFEMGRFGDLIQVYEGLAGGKSGNLHAAVALAEMHRRRGRTEDAVRQLESVVEQQPDNRGARRQLVGGLLQIGRTEQALRELDLLLAQPAAPETGNACPVCGATAPDSWVRCDRCDSWQEPARGLPPPRPRSIAVPAAD